MLGPDHPDVLSDQINLGNLLLRLGEPKAAQELLVPAVEVGRRVYDEGHPQMAKLLGALAGAYGDQGMLAQAVEADQEALAISLKVNGERSDNTLTIMNNLAARLRKLGEADRAQEMLTKVLNIRKETLGEESPIDLVVGPQPGRSSHEAWGV